MKIDTFAPASIGNFIVGFDILGLAVSDTTEPPLGDRVIIDDHTEHNHFSTTGPYSSQLPQDTDNLVMKARDLYHEYLIQHKTVKPKPLSIILEKNLPIGSGLGSSACSIVAAVGAMNAIYQNPLDTLTCLQMCGQLEAGISGGVHLDNVAPSLLGGLTLIEKENSLPKILEIPDHWRFVLCHPGTQLATKHARLVLPSTLSLKKSTAWSQQMALLIQALATGADDETFKPLLSDKVIEPHRFKLIPDFEKAKQIAFDNDALAFGISGAGPTMAVICTSDEIANTVATQLSELYHYNRSAFVRVCSADLEGIKTRNL
ncbi:MAG: homoserine kinase [Pseudomonadota bacterium]